MYQVANLVPSRRRPAPRARGDNYRAGNYFVDKRPEDRRGPGSFGIGSRRKRSGRGTGQRTGSVDSPSSSAPGLPPDVPDPLSSVANAAPPGLFAPGGPSPVRAPEPSDHTSRKITTSTTVPAFAPPGLFSAQRVEQQTEPKTRPSDIPLGVSQGGAPSSIPAFAQLLTTGAVGPAMPPQAVGPPSAPVPPDAVAGERLSGGKTQPAPGSRRGPRTAAGQRSSRFDGFGSWLLGRG